MSSWSERNAIEWVKFGQNGAEKTLSFRHSLFIHDSLFMMSGTKLITTLGLSVQLLEHIRTRGKRHENLAAEDASPGGSQ